MKKLLVALALTSLISFPAIAASEHDHSDSVPASAMEGNMDGMQNHMESMQEMMKKMQMETNTTKRKEIMKQHMKMMESSMDMMDDLYLMDQNQRRGCSYRPQTIKTPQRLSCKKTAEPMDMHMQMMHVMMKHMIERQKMIHQ